MLHDRHRKRAIAERKVELAAGHTQRERAAAVDEGRDFIDHRPVEGSDANGAGAVDLLSLEVREQLTYVAVSVHSHAVRPLAPAVQPLRIRQPDLYPRGDPSREVANDHYRLICRRQASRHLNALFVFETIREDPHEHERCGFRRMAGNAQLQRLVHAAVSVREVDADNVEG
jgi:hypothetical protein